MEKILSLNAIVEAFRALRKDKQYIAEAYELDQDFSDEIIEDTDDGRL